MKNTHTYEPISKDFPHFLHGGDYNPDQWRDYPEVLEEDMHLMRLSGCNTMTLGIFSWTMLEPAEDKFDFSFMDEMMDKLAANGTKVILATPSGARPAWMSKAHPEILRLDKELRHLTHGRRHNHCYTSTYYRKKVQQINRLLAERYKNHPALIGWHISNEYGGECYCDKCQNAFREWLKEKYNNDMEALNKAYWTAFWSHTYTDWEQIDAPTPLGEDCTHGLTLDWKRFVNHQTMEFMKCEIEPLKEITPDIPVTTNFMGCYYGLDYFKFKDIVDVVSWDSYPYWHVEKSEAETACEFAFEHDKFRSIKDGKPFILMESTPSCVNWRPYNKLKRPNMHILSSMQAVAHGSDTVQYFQWRKGRGCSEKFHGAVVDHCGHENTRVFKEVSRLGGMLSKMDDVVGSYVESEVAIFYDWENHWAIDDMRGLCNVDKKYPETLLKHYTPFWKKGINVDIVNKDSDFSGYKLLIAPMLYMTDSALIEKLKKFVSGGGTLVCTYVTGWVNEHDLCYLGGFPALDLKEVFGLWAEEIDTLYETDSNLVRLSSGNEYKAIDYCELVHAQGAEVLGRYTQDFYKDMPALLKNKYGQGSAYYIAFRSEEDFLTDFYSEIIKGAEIPCALDLKLPEGVTAHTRKSEKDTFVFVENYNDFSVELKLPEGKYTDLYTNQSVSALKLESFGCAVLKIKR